MKNGPLSPLEVINAFIGDNISSHEDAVDSVIQKINKELHKILDCQPGTEAAVLVELPGTSQVVLIEVVLLLRKMGWNVWYGMGTYGENNGQPFVRISVPQ